MMKSKKALLVVLGCLVVLLLASVLWFVLSNRVPDVPLPFWSVSFSPDGKLVTTAGGQGNPDARPKLGELLFWDSSSGRRKRSYQQASTIRTVTWAPNGKFIVVGDFEGGTTLLDPSTAKAIRSLPPHGGGAGGSVNAVVVSADSQLVASASVDGTVTLWDVPAQKELDALVLPPGEKVFNVAVSPDHKIVVAGGRRGKVYMFDLAKRGEPLALEVQPGSTRREPRVESIAFAPDGRTFVTGCQATLRLWETASGSLVREFSGAENPVNNVAFSPDGAALTAVDGAGMLKVWSVPAGDLLNSVPAHDGDVFAVAFSPDGKWIATAGRKDFQVRIWDAKSLNAVRTIYRTRQKR